VAAIANRILVRREDYGESKEDLEREWAKWIHHIPFDAPVARTLARLYQGRLDRLHKETDAAEYHRLERKLRLARNRASRYEPLSFSPEGE
jgi:hypothetical protein